jgi:hypothetical protein
MTPEETIQAIIKKLTDYMIDIRDVIATRIRQTTEWKDIQRIPQNELAKYINNYYEDSPQHFWISCRLSGEDPIKKDLSKCIPILWDQEFDCEAYRNIGFNDGMAIVVTNLFQILGMEKEATDTFEATYNDD